jgi:sensor histidine kinase YesM
LEIEKVRFSDRLVVELDVTADAYRCSVPSLLLQPIIENAIKYAIAQSEEGGIIRVSARVEDQVLMLTVDDSGPDDPQKTVSAPPENEDASGTGIGLQNIRERLTTLYGAMFSVEKGSSPLGGFRVRISIPVTAQPFLES